MTRQVTTGQRSDEGMHNPHTHPELADIARMLLTPRNTEDLFLADAKNSDEFEQ